MGISLTHTYKEWRLFKKRIYNASSIDTPTYLHNKTRKLINDFNKCPDCVLRFLLNVGNKKKAQHFAVSGDVYEKLSEISKKANGMPIAQIIDNVIIKPVLTEAP